MLALLQRVSSAEVRVNNESIARINEGLLVLLGVQRNDTEQQAERLLHRVVSYRIFSDKNDKMNLSLMEIKGELLVVPQFTLTADTKKGLRPSFTPAASPELGKSLFDYFVSLSKKTSLQVAAGQFGANMQVSLCNDGPVTFLLDE